MFGRKTAIRRLMIHLTLMLSVAGCDARAQEDTSETPGESPRVEKGHAEDSREHLSAKGVLSPEIVELIRSARLTPEGGRCGILRDVDQVCLVVDLQNSIMMSQEGRVWNLVARYLSDRGLPVVSRKQAMERLLREGKSTPDLIICVGTVVADGVVGFQVNQFLHDWMLTAANPAEPIYCTNSANLGSVGFIGSTASVFSAIGEQIDAVVIDFCETWKTARQLPSRSNEHTYPSVIVKPPSNAGYFAEEVVLAAILRGVAEVYVAVEYEDGQIPIKTDALRKHLEYEVGRLGIRVLNLDETKEKLEQTGCCPATVMARINLVTDGRWCAYSITLTVFRSMVRASAVNYVVECPVYNEGEFGLSSYYEFVTGFKRCASVVIAKFIANCAEAKGLDTY